MSVPEPRHQSRVTPRSSGVGGIGAYIAASLALAIWSGTAIANKVALVYMNDLTAGVLRSVIAGAAALVAVALMRLHLPPRRERLGIVFSGLASFAVWPLLMSIGIARTSATHAALIMATIPVFTALFAHIVERRVPSRAWWAGAAIAAAATTLLIMTRGGRTMSDHGAGVVGDFVILGGGVIAALGYVAGAKVAGRIGQAATTAWGLVAASVLVTPVFASIAGDTDWPQVAVQGWVAVAWMALLSSLVGYGLWFYALAHGGIARVGSLQLAMPVGTLVFAGWLLGEPLTTRTFMLGAANLVGTWWAHRHA